MSKDISAISRMTYWLIFSIQTTFKRYKKNSKIVHAFTINLGISSATL